MTNADSLKHNQLGKSQLLVAKAREMAPSYKRHRSGRAALSHGERHQGRVGGQKRTALRPTWPKGAPRLRTVPPPAPLLVRRRHAQPPRSPRAQGGERQAPPPPSRRLPPFHGQGEGQQELVRARRDRGGQRAARRGRNARATSYPVPPPTPPNP